MTNNDITCHISLIESVTTRENKKCRASANVALAPNRLIEERFHTMSNIQNYEHSQAADKATSSVSVMDTIRAANTIIDEIDLKIAKQEAYDQCMDEVEMLRKSLASLDPKDLRAIKARKRIEFLLGPKYQNYLSARCHLKQMVNNFGREIRYALFGLAKILLVIVFNMVALLLVFAWIF